MIPDLEIFLRLFISAVLGAAIGYERESARKAAGLRTHMIVCLGSALMTLVSVYAFEGVADPTRIAASILTGIGFLGAGTIFFTKGSVKGLTTAATIWMVAGLGLAIGVGFYAAALMTAALTVLILELPRFLRIETKVENGKIQGKTRVRTTYKG